MRLRGWHKKTKDQPPKSKEQTINLQRWISINQRVFSERDWRYLVRCIFSDSLSWDNYLDEKTLDRLEEIKKIYLEGVPLAYILGKEEFFGFEFKVNRNTFIPRPETELLVEKAIEIIKENTLKRILDLGTGVGNIAIVIKNYLLDNAPSIGKKIEIFSSDISFSALKIAKFNGNHYKSNIKFINSNLFEGLKKHTFDLIISNPPYVDPREIRGSLGYEPRVSLEAADGGFYFIERILREAYEFLTTGGYLIVEIGYSHKERVESLIESLKVYELIEGINDYAGYFRGIVLKAKGIEHSP